jgi:hypothetical protein
MVRKHGKLGASRPGRDTLGGIRINVLKPDEPVQKGIPLRRERNASRPPTERGSQRCLNRLSPLTP